MSQLRNRITEISLRNEIIVVRGVIVNVNGILLRITRALTSRCEYCALSVDRVQYCSFALHPLHAGAQQDLHLSTSDHGAHVDGFVALLLRDGLYLSR